jgi:flagellar hook-associated protein 2
LSDLGILGADGGSGDVGAADGYKNTLQHAINSSFTINGVQVERSANTNLTDVISGVTLNLAPDAAGRSATLNIGANWQTARASVDTFVEQFNKTQSYLESKMAITRIETGDNITYTRGALAGDSIFGDLRTNLMFAVGNSYNAGGVYQSLREIGITMDDNLAISVSDSAKLEAALNNNPDEVQKLLNGVMENFDSQLSRFTGAKNVEGYLDSASKNIAEDLKAANDDISDFEARLVEKQAFYTEQYGQLQAQMMLLSYQQQTWQSIYGQTSSYG